MNKSKVAMNENNKLYERLLQSQIEKVELQKEKSKAKRLQPSNNCWAGKFQIIPFGVWFWIPFP